ncbi:MAG TPA: hypothetical protein VGG33_10890, partial [Polyangia bacterium]
MIDKVLGKVRSWLHIDSSVSVATPSPNGSGALTGPAIPRKSGRATKNVRVREPSRSEAEAERAATPAVAGIEPAPPPPPAEPFSRTMDGQPESGMVIGESGIIIIDDPNNAEAKTVAGGGSGDSWALPNLKELPVPPPAPAAAKA